MGTDFRDLANSLVNNKQFHLPAVDTWRMGVVVGYDPAYNFDSESGPFRLPPFPFSRKRKCITRHPD